MTDDERSLLDQAFGHALYAATIAELTFASLVKADIIPKDDAARILDEAIHAYERAHLAPGAPSAASLEHVRARLQGLLGRYRTTTPGPKPDVA